MGFRRFIFFYLFIFMSLSQVFSADDFTLELRHVRETMEKMFAYHVENREYSPLIVRRSFKIYIQQFDPRRLYLMKREIEPFLHLSDQSVNQMIYHYKQDYYPAYVNLNTIIQKSIIRNRQIRQEVAQQIIQEGNELFKASFIEKDNDDYADTFEELHRRIKGLLVQEVKATLKSKGMIHPSSEVIQKILEFRENKTILNEKTYLSQEEELDNHYLALHILKAMSKSLDAHSGYYSPKEAYEIRANLKKEFSGIGIVLREEFDGIYIADLIHGGPAYRSQEVTIGDKLIGLNNQLITHKSFEQILDIMKGKSGSKLILNIKKKEEEQSKAVELIREKIVMNNDRLSLEIEPFADGVIGKITVPGFYDNGGQISTEKDLCEALRTLRTYGKIYGLILDLRENSGGFLTQAIKVSAMFINGGIIVVSKYADEEVSYARDIDGRHYYTGPLVALISKASASAAEIVSGALQDHGVALIVGDKRSYGKGSMQYQTLTDENATSFFKVTVGRYYTASGRSPQITGVKSDIHVPTILHAYNIGERYLEHPISGDQLTDEVFKSLTQIKPRTLKNTPILAIPYLHPHSSQWRQMLSTLCCNSQKRLNNDHNFQFFLEMTKGYQPKQSSFQNTQARIPPNFGVDDLQIKEAIEIIKDMSIMCLPSYLRECK